LKRRPFIGWDGEGYNAFVGHVDGPPDIEHRYMLFGNSVGQCRKAIKLTTGQCLELIIQTKLAHPKSPFVGFAFEYDVNMILCDLQWTHLNLLAATNHCRWKDPLTGLRYRIEHIPHKWLKVSSRGVVATINDCFGFFHSSYMAALNKYNVGDPEQRARIQAGKNRRGHFTWADIAEVESYWRDEISLFAPLMDHVRDATYSGGYYITEWYGPGALAAYLLRKCGAKQWHSRSVPKEVKYAIRVAYAGGRFLLSQCGLYLGDVYTADINSAYIYACSLLPRMDRGKWLRKRPDEVDSERLPRFGLYHISFDAGPEWADMARTAGIPEPPYPLFHRDKDGTLRWPRKSTGWYWTPEAELVLDYPGTKILEAWVFDDDGSYPFRFVHETFARRLALQKAGDPAEKPFKWALAAMYGAFARRIGWDQETRKPPSSHELAWAGYITSWCRAAVHKPAMDAYLKGKSRGLISIDTDGITSTVPFDLSSLCNGVGENLGQWKLEHYTGILQWQNGIYWLRDEKGVWQDPKSRGVPKGSIPRAAAMEALAAADFRVRPIVHARITIPKTAFIGYRQALRGQFSRVRRWITSDQKIIMGGDPNGKAFHFYGQCIKCLNPDLADRNDIMHTVSLTAPRFSTESCPHRLPWLEEQPTLTDNMIAGIANFNLTEGPMI
jgi:hypothetical protein